MFFSNHIKILLHIYCLLLTHTHSLNYSDPESNSADVLAEVNDSLLNNTLSDYNEEKNNSESIHKILEDFEKTLDNNKKIYDLDHVDTAVDVIEDSVITDGNKQEDTSTDTSKVSDESVKEEATDNSTKTRLACNNTEPVNGSSPHVFLVNATQYQAYLHEEHNVSVANRSQPGTCSITMFFAPWCEFSAGAAPHYNALARVFPQLRLYAVDSSEHHSLNTQYGVMAVPSIFVFHNSRPLYKYNYTEYNLSSFTQFVSLLTGLEPANVTDMIEADYIGPVPTVAVETTNYYLLLAWMFTLMCGVWHVSTSQWLHWLLDIVRNAWREAEIQHEHEE